MRVLYDCSYDPSITLLCVCVTAAVECGSWEWADSWFSCRQAAAECTGLVLVRDTDSVSQPVGCDVRPHAPNCYCCETETLRPLTHCLIVFQLF